MAETDNSKAPGPRAAVKLEAAMEQRRVELRMSWREVSSAAGMSYEGLRAIRKGDRHPNPVTKGRIEDALQWSSGSVDAVLAGGEPTPAQPPQPSLRNDPDELARVEALLEEAMAELNRLKQKRSG